MSEFKLRDRVEYEFKDKFTSTHHPDGKGTGYIANISLLEVGTIQLALKPFVELRVEGKPVVVPAEGLVYYRVRITGCGARDPYTPWLTTSEVRKIIKK